MDRYLTGEDDEATGVFEEPDAEVERDLYDDDYRDDADAWVGREPW